MLWNAGCPADGVRLGPEPAQRRDLLPGHRPQAGGATGTTVFFETEDEACAELLLRVISDPTTRRR